QHGSTFKNLVGATVTINGGGHWITDGSGSFENLGTLTVAAGANTTQIDPFLTNSGGVLVTSGTLQLTLGANVAGSFSIPANTTLQLGDGLTYSAFAFSATASISGAGTVRFGFNAAANFAASSTYNITGATAIDTRISDPDIVFTANSKVQA